MCFSVDFITQFKAPVWFQKGLLICNPHLYGQEWIPKSWEFGIRKWDLERNELGLQDQDMNCSV